MAVPSIVLTVLSLACSHAGTSDANALWQLISARRHTDPAAARKIAKQAYEDSQLNRFTKDWGQRFRILYADILIEQNSPLRGRSLFDVIRLLTFVPNNPEIKGRQEAALGYLEMKKPDLKMERARELNEHALTAFKDIPDSCWRTEVSLHYAQILISLRSNEIDDQLIVQQLLKANLLSQSCSDRYWEAFLHFIKASFADSRTFYQEERSEFETALALAESYGFPDLVAPTIANLANTYIRVGDFDKALALLNRTRGSKETDRAGLRAVKGFIHNLRNENEAARSEYLQAVRILQPSKTETYYSYLENLTSVLIEMQRLDEADRVNKEVLEDFVPSGQIDWILKEAMLNAASIDRLKGNIDASFQKLTKLQSGYRDETDAQVLSRLHSEFAQTLNAMRRGKEADREYREAVQAASKAREEMSSDQDRMTFSIYVERLVSRYIDFLVDRKASADASLKVAETFRAQRLAERLHNDKTPAQEKLRAIASVRDAVILSYWITKQNSYLWATNARHTEIFILKDLQNLDRDIQNHNLTIADQRDLLQTPDSSTDLYRKLIAPAESLILPESNVIIVPSGPLTTLNFETLVPPARPAQYWLKTVTLTVAPSLSLANNSTNLQSRFLLVGDTIPKGQAALPGSSSEIKDIKQLFPNINKLELTGVSATPQHFLESRPGDFSLLHISSHAFANKVSPLDSYIMMTPDATHTDGYLYAHDLMNLHLNEDLVTLSACEGAGGKSLPGEGQVGLTWAILSAGAKNVVASSFRVSDHATASFMREFYQRLTAGEKPAQALHDTKLAMINKSMVPYFWAAFQLYTR